MNQTWFDASVGSRLEALAALWAQLDQMDDFWVQGHLEHRVGTELKAQNRRYFESFRAEVWEPYQAAQQAHDEAAMARCRARFGALLEDEGFKAHGQQVMGHFERAGRIKKWTKVVVAIGLAVVAFGLGQWQFAMLAPELGVVGASVVAGVSTSLIQTTLERLVLGHTPTVGGFVVGAATNVATFVVVGKLMNAARGAAVEAEVTEALRGGAAQRTSGAATLVKQQILQLAVAEALGVATAQAAKLIDGGGALTEEELGEILVQQLISAIGMQAGQLALDGAIAQFASLRPAAKRCGIDLAGLDHEHHAIVELAKALEAKAKAEPLGLPDRATALQLTTRAKRHLDQLEAARAHLLEFAQLHPLLIGKRDVAFLRASEGELALRGQLDTATALLGIETYGPGLYRCESPALPVLLEQQRKAGSTLERVEVDAAAHERTFTFKTSTQQEIYVTERLAPKTSELPVPEKELQAAGQAKALEALERGDALTSDRYLLATEIARQVPAGPLEITAIDHDAKTLIAIVTPGSGETGIKTLNDKLVGPTITTRLLNARTEALRTVFAKHDMHLVANDYKTIKVVSSKPPAEMAAALKLALVEIDGALRVKLRHTLEDGLVEWSDQLVRGEPGSAAVNAARVRVEAITRALEKVRTAPDFTLGLQFGVAELAGTGHLQLDAAARNASRAAVLAKLTPTAERPAGTDIGDARGMVYSEAHYRDKVAHVESLKTKLQGRTLPMVGTRRRVLDEYGRPDPHLTYAVRKHKLDTSKLSPDDHGVLETFQEYLPYANTLDYMSPYLGGETALAAQQGHQAAELIRALEAGRRLTSPELEQLRSLLRGDWAQAGTASEAVFWNRIARTKNRVVVSADIKDLGVDVIRAGAAGMTDISRGRQISDVARRASDGVVEMKRQIVGDLQQFYKRELLPEARHRAAMQQRDDLTAVLGHSEETLLFEVGGDDITISLPHAFEELGLVPRLVEHLQTNARSRVAVTRTGNVEGGRGHAKAAAEAEPAHDALKDYEELARYLGLIEKRLPVEDGRRAADLKNYFGRLYTSSDADGRFRVLDSDGPITDQELRALMLEARLLIAKGEQGHD